MTNLKAGYLLSVHENRGDGAQIHVTLSMDMVNFEVFGRPQESQGSSSSTIHKGQ
jgi:hypothetical protein